jgi:hypothetical protein
MSIWRQDYKRSLKYFHLFAFIITAALTVLPAFTSVSVGLYVNVVTLKQQLISTEMFIWGLKQHFRQTW